MELTIFNTYVVMESQEQCDRMKQLCIDNELPINKRLISFLVFSFFNEFYFYDKSNWFSVLYGAVEENKTQVTEQEFINLLNKHNEQTKTKNRS